MQLGWMTHELYSELRHLYNVLCFRKIGFEDESSSELAQDHVSSHMSVSSMLNIWGLLSENWLMIDDRKLRCDRRNGSFISRK
jgi:hypothetical protein